MKISPSRAIEALESIRTSLSERTSMPTGTVIRFVREKRVVRGAAFQESSQTITLSYAAIYVNDLWYLTGTAGVGASSYTNKEFMDLLSSGDYTEIAVATEFETI